MENLSRHLEQQHAGGHPRPRLEPGRPLASARFAEERGAVSHAAGEAAWEWDTARNVISRGGAFLQVSGFTAEEIPAHPDWWKQRIHPEDRAAVLAALDAVLMGERRESVLLYRFQRKDGAYALLLDRAFALTTAGSVERIVGFTREVGWPVPIEADDEGQASGVAENSPEVDPARSRGPVGQVDDSSAAEPWSPLEEERYRVSRELHDEVGQLLTALRIVIQSRSFSRDNADEIIDELFCRVRDIAAGLRPPMLEDLGLAASLGWHCERFSTRTGIQVNRIFTGVAQRYAPAIELTVFRVVQEALTNVARHAVTKKVWVSVHGTGKQLTGIVVDGGVGFEPDRRQQLSSSGIAGMRQRMASIGGRLMVTSRPGRGTRIFFRIPIRAEDRPPPHEVPR